MKERLGLILLAALSLSACNEQKDTSNGTGELGSYQGRSFSVIGKLRPQADPSVMAQIHSEEEARRQAALAAAEREMQARQQQEQQAANQNANLPEVNNSNFGPGPLPSVGGAPDYSAQAQQAAQQAQANQIAQSWAAPMQQAPPPPQAASYGINYSQPSPGFVPPPPAVSLSTSAVPMPYGMPPPGYNPYANPYANPYQQPADPGPVASAGRPKGSLFGSGSGGGSSSSDRDDDDEPKKKKEKPIQIITPTGMEPRSPYKQRDELRMLWKGALASSLSGINADSKFAEGLAKIDVSLPGESSKGALSVQQRTIDGLFKNTAAVDKKVVGVVKKTQSDLVQAYYRYLYSYNKFYLTQQQVQARKQELDYAETTAERQRATVDMAQASQEADASKEDMRSSQNDLAAIVGAQAARTVIKNVSGVTPSLDSLAQAESAQQGQGDGGFGGIMSVFGFGKKPKEVSSAGQDDVQVANENKGKEEKSTKEGKEKKEKHKKDKGDKGGSDKQQIASSKAESPSSKSDAPDPPAAVAQAPASSGPVSFELKDVKTTPRKSILRVSVKNTGADNFNFDVDSIAVADGNTKLTEASVSAEFDSTVVQPSQEVTGTITIFGRPWNDKITVSLLDGKKSIVLHR